MTRRYSDINRGPLLAQAYQRKLQYYSRDISERNANSQLGTRTRSPRVLVMVRPFGVDLSGTNDADTYLVETNQRNRQQLADNIGTRARVPGDTSTPQVNGNFTPAKIKLFVQTSRQPSTSRVTGLRYLRAVGQSYSHPFGQATATDRLIETFNVIANDLRNDGPNNRVTYSPEKLGQR